MVLSGGRSIDAGAGAPGYVPFDHNSALIATAVAASCRFDGAGTVFIKPGAPRQKAWIESFNDRLRDEHPNGRLANSPGRWLRHRETRPRVLLLVDDRSVCVLDRGGEFRADLEIDPQAICQAKKA